MRKRTSHRRWPFGYPTQYRNGSRAHHYDTPNTFRRLQATHRRIEASFRYLGLAPPKLAGNLRVKLGTRSG